MKARMFFWQIKTTNFSTFFLCFCTIKFCYCYFKNVKEVSTILSHVPNMAFQHVSHWWRRRNTCVWVDYNVYYLTVQQPGSEHELDHNQLVRAPADFVIILSYLSDSLLLWKKRFLFQYLQVNYSSSESLKIFFASKPLHYLSSRKQCRPFSPKIHNDFSN